MVEIIPAILPKSYADLEEKLALIHEAAGAVQIDVVDGVFAPNKTWPYASNEMFADIVGQDAGLPFWEDLDFQFDCMIDASEDIEQFIAAGASTLVVHGAGEHAKKVLETLQKARSGDLATLVGIALLPSDDAATFTQYKELVDFVQVMGIEKVGFQGSEFDPRALNLITSLRQNHAELTIQVDGGVKKQNIKLLVEAGATKLVVGSAIFGAQDPVNAFEVLTREANK
jgi:ribulose-phosphate 3-epimerase